MSEDREVSPGGSNIYRHTGEGKAFEFSAGDFELIEEVSAHMDRVLGPSAQVFHEIISHLVHVDVHIVEPTEARPHFVLYTTGMSERPMTVPEQQMRESGADPDAFRYAELLIALPRDWFGSGGYAQANLKDERVYWPIRMLKFLARMPHEYDTWFGAFHTIPNGDPPQPVAKGTGLAGVIILPAVMLDEADRVATLSDGRRVNLLQLFPLYPEEFDLKLRDGSDALMAAMDQRGISWIVDTNRPSVARRKRWLGLF